MQPKIKEEIKLIKKNKRNNVDAEGGPADSFGVTEWASPSAGLSQCQHLPTEGHSRVAALTGADDQAV